MVYSNLGADRLKGTNILYIADNQPFDYTILTVLGNEKCLF